MSDQGSSLSSREVALAERIAMSELLRRSGGSYIKAFENLAREVQNASKIPRTSVEQRKKSWLEALAKMDEDKLLDMQEKMSDYVDLLSKHEISFEELPTELNDVQRVQLMRSALMSKDIKEFIETYYEWVRKVVFEVVAEEKSREGVDDPEHAKGEIKVPELGKRFCKQGGGRKDPILDQEKLKELLGEQWEDACEAEILPPITLPERVEHHFSVEKLMKLAETNPSILEKIRECLRPGEFKSNSFTILNL